MTPELIKQLLTWAVFYTGYTMPAELPVIEYVPHSYFVQTICYNEDTAENPCGVRAMYDDNNDGVIYLNEKFIDDIDPYTKSIIVHEMVHYLQDMSGEWKDIEKWDRTIRCQEREYRQREAYMVQDKYSDDVHNIRRLVPRRFGGCGER